MISKDRKEIWEKDVDQDDFLSNIVVDYAINLKKDGQEKEAEEILRNLAESGFARAMYELGELYRHQRGIRDEEGIQWILRAGENGDVSAMIKMSHNYFYGQGFPEDKQRAFEWAIEAACNGSERGADNIFAIMDRWTPRMTVEQRKFVEYVRKLGRKASRMICAKMAEDYADDLYLSLKWSRYAANLGDEVAMGKMGDYYFDKDSPAFDEMAVEWFRKLANKGNAYGQYSMGFCYEMGRGVEQDPNEAFRYYKMAAYNTKRANACAMYSLADMYEAGEVVEQNLEEAEQLRERADELEAIAGNNIELQQEIGRGLYEEALLLQETDLEEAHDKLSTAAMVYDYVPAMILLGHWYREGIGCETNLSIASSYYRHAAEAGDPDGMYWLAWYLEQDGGSKEYVKQCRKEAKELYMKAADLGQQEAMKRMKKGFGLFW